MRDKLFRLLLLAYLFLTASFISSAQKTMRLGFKGGISIPNLKSGDDNEVSTGYSSRLGADIAIFGEFYLSDFLSLQPQIEFSGQGGKKDGLQAFATPPAYVQMFPPGMAPQYLYATYKSEARINYLMIPILVKTRFALGKSVDIYTAVGPFVSFVMSAKNVTSGSSNIYLDKQQTQPITFAPESFDREEDIKDDLHKTNVGVEAAAGFSFGFGRSEIFIEGGVNYGFIKIQKDKANGQNNTGAAMVTIGYAFKLKN